MKSNIEANQQYELFDETVPREAKFTYAPFEGRSALEDGDFPFETLSNIAEIESWRKEIHRPIYHIHKWWAQRLGTVFRAITLAALTPKGTDLIDVFYSRPKLTDAIIFDPFMGSGTTLGEAAKLGARVIGRDINPVAYFLVRNALSVHDRVQVEDEFRRIERDVAEHLRSYYRTTLPNGRTADVLYFFWVKVATCLSCQIKVDLFSSRIFAKHANAKRYPKSRATCPNCGKINVVRHDARNAICDSCQSRFHPQQGSVNGRQATCPQCGHTFPIAKTIQAGGQPPEHRMYAKLVLLPDGTKEYHQITDEDRCLYDRAAEELKTRPNGYPIVAIESGYNTNQAIGYNYRHWHEMFNARQLVCLSILAERIKQIREPALRDLFTCLFSGVLEFNNMFASYKGEGTGAVRHMFAHHILKPERTPIEANLWGTRKSSGSFITMFERRIRRALDYADNPFELSVASRNPRKSATKIYGLSESLGYTLATTYKEFLSGKQVYLSCGDSGATDLAEGSVDAVITDPPFFDNVHYSQLADFFHVWQRYILGESGHFANCTTRSALEVQNVDAGQFTNRLKAVWIESYRVLKNSGILVFTYHHSRTEGWHSILEALMSSGFMITAAWPIKAEMSVAIPKRQAKEPINLDIIVVCRKRPRPACRTGNGDLWGTAMSAAAGQVMRLRSSGRMLSRNDIRVIIMAQLLQRLSCSCNVETALALLKDSESKVKLEISMLYDEIGL